MKFWLKPCGVLRILVAEPLSYNPSRFLCVVVWTAWSSPSMLLSTRGHLWSLLSLTIHPASASLVVWSAPFYLIMRGCLCSCERVPAGPGLSAARDPRAPGPSWIGSLFRLLSLQVTQDFLELDVQTCPIISLREALLKFLCPETRILPLFLPDWLASVPIFHRTSFSCWGCQHSGVSHASCAQLSCGSHLILLSTYQYNSDPSSMSSTRITPCSPRVT